MSSIYEEPFKAALLAYRMDNLGRFQTEPPEVDPNDGPALKAAIEHATKMVAEIPQQEPKPFEFDFNRLTEDQLAAPMAIYSSKRAAADEAYEAELTRLNAAYQEQVASAQAASEASVSGLTKMYDELLTYKDKVRDAVMRYDIKPSDLAIDEDKLTREDMEALVQTALTACKNLGGDSGLRPKLKHIFDSVQEAEDFSTQCFWLVLITVGFVIAAPVIFCLIVGNLAISLRHMHRNVQGLQIADKLMYGINFQRFRDDPHIDDIPAVDTTEIDRIREEAYADAEKFNPEDKRAELRKELLPLLTEFNQQIQAANEEVMRAYKLFFMKWNAHKAEVEGAFAEFCANRKTFADNQSQHMVLTYDATVGLEDEVIETTMPYLETNIVFANRDALMLQFQKLLLANMLLNVQPTHLTVTIFDPERLGQDFATFLDDACKDYIFVETKDLPHILDEHRNYAKDSFRILDTRTITEFNQEAEEKGMVTRDYKLLFIASPDESLYKNEAFLSFMRTSVRAGVHVWMVGPTPIEDCQFFAEPFYLVPHPYPVTQELISRCMRTYLDGLENRKDKGIMYISSFQEKYLPRERWWTENCDKGTKVNLGLQDGDPSKGYDILIGDMPVHALAGGATGAGKSAFLNQMLASLILRYPPSALELILVDFKNVEFVQLKDKKTNYSRIPHAKILAGTKDGEYAKSIFEYLLADMEKRNEAFQAVGAKKLESYNSWMRGQGTPEKCFPRTLLIIDEFQVMFSLDQKIVGEIQELIKQLSKLGRSAGVHMFFTSQSMTGTMPKDVKDQFSLRIALRCSQETSEELIGCNLASTIKAKFGYLYSNTNAGATQDTTALWRTPFLDEHILYDEDKLAEKIAKGKEPEGTKTILTMLAEMVKECGEIDRHAYFYDSKEVWTHERIDYWFETYPEVFEKNPGSVLLGERTAFSTKVMPNNFRFTRADGENLLIYAREDTDMCNIISTIYKCLAHDPNNIILMNSADIDYYEVLDVASKVSPQFAELAKPMKSPVDWMSQLEAIINRRKAEGMEGKKPVYFFAIRWDKQNDLYKGENYNNMDRLKNILTDGPSVDVHFILPLTTYTNFRTGHLSLFNHMIVGQGDAQAGYKFIDFGHNDAIYDNEDAPCAFYVYGTDRVKFKIYSFPYTKTFQSREIEV